MLKKDQLTSLVTNFENSPLNSVKVFKEKDLVIFDEKKNQLRKLEDFNKDYESESFWSENSQSAEVVSDSGEDSEEGIERCPSDRLFIGVIDINKCEEDARSLYNKLLNEGDNFSTDFLCGFRSVELKRNIINLPSTFEELKEAQRVCSDVSRSLDCYNEFMPKIQYFKPHTANAKRFLNNAEFINRQLNLYNESKESISSFLGIEENEFSKLIRYYSKPRVNSIKNFIEKQTNKARYDSEIAEELKKFIKTKIRQWI